ncbi:ABC transporter ATP-binding protein [Shimia sp.]|uniref:ABC transporter ATP-binding protein n=1 Tax=Shimia sp. TaxID=1954381 RepID=UPI0035676BAA
MIVFRDLCKSFVVNGERNPVIDRVNACFPTGAAVGLLGRNGAGKSTLLQMIAGTITPTSGEILSDGSISFPVGFAGSFHPDLTGAQNVRFVARIYGIESDALLDFVADFAELGRAFHRPFRSYSSGMRSRLAFGVSMGIPFDTYLLDEVTSVGDAAFRRKSTDYLRARMQNAGVVFVSHSIPMVREICSAAAVLENGNLHYFEDVEEGIALHQEMLRGG